MKTGNRLLYIAACIVLIIPILLTANDARAKYVGDNAVPDGLGGWALPADKGFCVTGIKSDGTMILDLTVNSRPDCLAKTWPAYTTQATCRTSDSAGANTEGSHFWISTCVDASGNGISLSGLDRTASICAQKGGTLKQACTSNWTLMGPAWSAAPVSTTAGGTDGFCYTAIRLDNYTQGTCPAVGPNTGTFGYAFNTTTNSCTYSYGVQGKVNGNITNMQGAVTAAGTNVDLTTATYDTQGECTFAGYSWSNHTTKGGTAAVATVDPAGSTIATPITQVRAGCLSCHNKTSQYNSVAGRWKSDYLKTGHKNMLRKVTPGTSWAGPDGVVYTEAAGRQKLDFVNGLVDGAFGFAKTLMYIFGNWMAPAPDALDTIVWRDDLVPAKAQYNGTSNYSCGPCHTTGWSGPAGSGVCVAGGVGKPTSGTGAITTQASCTAISGTWFFSSGEQSDAAGNYLGTYAPVEPGISWPGKGDGNNFINGITGRWDHDGIICNRCHKVAYDPTFPINDEGVNAPPGFTTHETDIFDGWKCVSTCFSCHQSTPYTNNGTGDTGVNNVDLNPVKLQVKNTATAPAYVPEFNSHPIGNMFLNSPHGQFTGSMLPNKLGKYDLVSGGTVASSFVGKLCRSSTTAGGGNILETTATGGKIASLADCNVANGKPVGDVTEYGYWQDEPGGGSCITCHNVHESLFDPDAEEPIRRECTTCHVDDPASYPTARQIADINHPGGTGTPLENAATEPAQSCEICHMPKATDGGFPMHIWRINADASYSTFPTATEFGIGATATKKIANTAPDGAYTDAVWVDVDLTCGQCHGPAGSAHLISKGSIAFYAGAMHTRGSGIPSTTCEDCHTKTVAHEEGPGTPPKCLTCHGTTRPGVRPTVTAACITCHSSDFAAHTFTADQLAPYAAAIHAGGAFPTCATCHTGYKMKWVNHPNNPSRGTPSCKDCHTFNRPFNKQVQPLKAGERPTVAAACNHCHGGSDGPNAVKPGVNYIAAAELANVAKHIHQDRAPKASMKLVVTDRKPDVSGKQVYIGDTVQVNDTSTKGTGTLSKIKVKWGDGTVSMIAPGESATHVYSAKGSVTIILVAIDADGLKSSVTRQITVIKNKL